MKENEDVFEYEWYRQYLGVGEYVKWSGAPEKRGSFNPIYLFVIPFMLVWCFSVVTGTVDIIRDIISGEGEVIELFFMIPFWVGGVFMIIAIFIAPAVTRRNTKYAVTNKRVIEKCGKRVNMISLDPMPNVQVNVGGKRGIGSVTVGSDNVYVNDGPRFMSFNRGRTGITLSDIKDPTKVYDMIVSGR